MSEFMVKGRKQYCVSAGFHSVVSSSRWFGFTWLRLFCFNAVVLPLPPTAGNLDLAQVASSLLYRELARSLPLSFPSVPHFRRWPIARFAGHTCRHAFPIGDILAGRQGTSFSAPRDPSPTAAVDHAVSASRTPDLNPPSSAWWASLGARAFRLLVASSAWPPESFSRFDPSSSACASSYSSLLPLPHPPHPGRLRSFPSPSCPASSRKLPPEPAQSPGRTFLPGRRSERGAVDCRCRPRSSVTLP